VERANSSSEEIDFFEYGKMKPFQLFILYGVIDEMACVGSLKSNGYHELLNYPDNFKVSFNVL
jgi:hypothetical protein